MTEVLTAAQMRAIEQAAIASGEVTGLELMERAGQGVVEAIYKEWPEFSREWGPAPTPPEYLDFKEDEALRAVVLCGPGNNGGDGFVVARLLRARGWDVEVFFYGDASRLPPDARVNYERWSDLGAVTARKLDTPPLNDDTFVIDGSADLLIDALFGIGLTREFRGVFASLADPTAQERIRDAGVRSLAIDVPSGLCADDGRVLGAVLPASLTVTFHALKHGHLIGRGPEVCGKQVVQDIGLAAFADIIMCALKRKRKN